MKLVIYMPALNEEGSLRRVLEGLPGHLEGVDSIEVLVVDDGSTDNTAAVALAARAQVVSHGRNRGVGAAFQSALQYALENGAGLLVGIDADGQFDSAQIPALIQPILFNRADVVIGNRFSEGRPAYMSQIKYWGNNSISSLISYVTGQRFRDVSCGFRAYSREALLKLNVFGEFTYTHETILSSAYQALRVLEEPISVRYFPERKSRVAGSLVHYARRTSTIILRVMLDYRPMRVFGTLAAICLLMGVGFGTFLLGQFILTGSFSPYKSAGFIGLAFGVFGLLVLLIALIADMLNRLRMNQDRLLYELKKTRYGD